MTETNLTWPTSSWTAPSIASVVDQPQRASRSGEAKLLKEATDEATQLIDDELLDLLVGLDV